MQLKWNALAEKNIPAGEGTVGLIMTYGTKAREISILKVIRIPIIGTQYDLADFTQVEEMINDNLETLIDINENLGWVIENDSVLSSEQHAHTFILQASPMLARAPSVAYSESKLANETNSLNMLGLIHTVAHLLMRSAKQGSGYDENSLMELYTGNYLFWKVSSLNAFLDALSTSVKSLSVFSFWYDFLWPLTLSILQSNWSFILKNSWYNSKLAIRFPFFE